MSFDSQFSEILNKMLYTYKEDVLEKVKTETEYALTENIQKNMYRAYSPLKYKRTYHFLNSIASDINITSEKIESIVYFDNMYLDHMRDGRRVYVPYLVQTNEPKRNEIGWSPDARRDTSFYAQTNLAMMKSYYTQKRLLRGRRIIY